MSVRLTTLKKRADFVRIAKQGQKWVSPGLIVQAMRRPISLSEDADLLRVGFTASKKVGNAVARNRAKRRLRAVIRDLKNQADQNLDFVLIARQSTVDYDYDKLTRETYKAFKKLPKLVHQGRKPR